jgi:hypothetical protein
MMLPPVSILEGERQRARVRFHNQSIAGGRALFGCKAKNSEESNPPQRIQS